MENSYLCPYCRGHLKVEKHITFSVKTAAGARGLLFLSPKLGDYHCINHETFELKEGECLDIFCPICHSNLKALSVNKNLAKVVMIDKNANEYDVYFSEIVGEKCTYKIHEKDIESFGTNAAEYINFFGV